MSSYDKHYQQENLFGRPYPEFVAFMRDWEPRGSVLDIGCGQGRDALFLAELGYAVTGIDASPLGIRQMLAAAKARSLSLNGIVADFYTYAFEQTYDVIVLDSILHFHKKDLAKELALLQTLTTRLKPGGLICLFVHKSKAKERQLKQFFAQNHPKWPFWPPATSTTSTKNRTPTSHQPRNFLCFLAKWARNRLILRPFL